MPLKSSASNYLAYAISSNSPYSIQQQQQFSNHNFTSLIMKNTPRLIALLVFSVSLFIASDKQTFAADDPYSTPNAVYNEYREASNKKDWRRVWKCLSRPLQLEEMHGFLIAAETSSDPNFKLALKKFGADESAITAEYQRLHKQKYKTNQQNDLQPHDMELIYEALSNQIVDKVGLFEAFYNILGNRPDWTPLGELSELTINGDQAKGLRTVIVKPTAVNPIEQQKIIGVKVSSEVHFVKTKEGWRIR